MMRANHAKEIPDDTVAWQSKLGAAERQQQEHYDIIAADTKHTTATSGASSIAGGLCTTRCLKASTFRE